MPFRRRGTACTLHRAAAVVRRTLTSRRWAVEVGRHNAMGQARIVRHGRPTPGTITRWSIALVLGAVTGLGRPGTAGAQASGLAEYLTRLGIDAQQRAAAARGRAVAKLLPTQDNRDVTIFGMVGLNVPRDTAVARARDVERFLAARGVRAHLFGNPPSPDDVRDAAFA